MSHKPVLDLEKEAARLSKFSEKQLNNFKQVFNYELKRRRNDILKSGWKLS